MLKLFNTLSRKKEIFRPIFPPRANMYVCGPTVYGPGHVGHARTYIAFDIIRRYLEYKGFNVKYVMNITDVHDDIIREANKQNILVINIAIKFTKLFLEEQNKLGIKKADYYPRVTENIREIIDYIKKIMKAGFAYQQGSSVYFDVSKFKDYGKLSKIKTKKSITGTRVQTDKYERKEAIDFALWKEAKPGEPSWSSPWGKGRPGWHIECSVMSQKYLRKQIDIHGGAKDLIFPHHENEIAQSETATGKKPFVKYWMHGGLLTINKQKMSKSLGNYIGIIEVFRKWSPRTIRLFVASSHYRSSLDWNEKSLLQAKKGIEKIDEFTNKLERISKEKKANKKYVNDLLLKTRGEFEKAMDDDFNTPLAMATVFNLINKGNSLITQGKLTSLDARIILDFFKKIDQIFNFIFWEKPKIKISERISKLATEREKYRQKGDWKSADEIRKKVKEMGYWIEDTKEGPKIRKL